MARAAPIRTSSSSRSGSALRHLTLDDAPFILRLVNEPSWLEFIGDKGVRSLEDARAYLANGPIAMYARAGFGLYMTELKEGASRSACAV